MNRSRLGRMLLVAGLSSGLLGDPLTAMTEGSSGWFLVRDASTELRSAPSSAPGYPVAVLAPGTPVNLDGTPVDGWAMVRSEGPALDEVRGLVEIDDRVTLDGETITVVEPTTLFALNLRSRIDADTYLPARSWMELASLDRGESLGTSQVFDMDGSTWAIVPPPEGTRFWVNTATLRPATEAERADLARTIVTSPATGAVSRVPLRPVLARPVATATEPIVSVDADGDWFVSNRDKLAVRSAPLDRPSYTVRTLKKGEPLLVVDIVDGSAIVALRGAIGDLPGILQLDDRVEVVGDMAHIVGPTEVRTPNLNAALSDGTFNPARCWQTMAEPRPGDTLAVRRRFTANDREWLLVSPPPDVTLDVLLGQLRPARVEEIPAPDEERCWPPRPKTAVADAGETATDVEAESPDTSPTDEDAAVERVASRPEPDEEPIEEPVLLEIDNLDISTPTIAESSPDSEEVTPVDASVPATIDGDEIEPTEGVAPLDIDDATPAEAPATVDGDEVEPTEEVAPLDIDDATPAEAPATVDGDEVEPTEEVAPLDIDDATPAEAPATIDGDEVEPTEEVAPLDIDDATPAEAPATIDGDEVEPTEEVAPLDIDDATPATGTSDPVATETERAPAESVVDPDSNTILDLIDDPETPVIVEIVRDRSGTVETAAPSGQVAAEDPEVGLFPDDTAGSTERWGTDTEEVVLPGGLSTRWGVSRSSQLGLRSEPSMETGYVVAVVDRGDVVAVSGEDGDWLRVRLIGPELDDVRGLMREEPGGFHAYGKRLRVVSGQHDVLAPNTQETLPGVRSRSGDEVVDPAKAWVPLSTLRPGDEVVTTDSFVDDDGTTWYLVIPAQTSEVWCHRAFLRPALATEMPTARGLDLAGRPNIVDGPRPYGETENRTPAVPPGPSDVAVLTTDEPVTSESETVDLDILDPEMTEPDPNTIESTATESVVVEIDAVEPIEPEMSEAEGVDSETPATEPADVVEVDVVEVDEDVEVVETEVAEGVVEADVVEVTEDAPIVEDVEVVEVVETEVAKDAVEVTEDTVVVEVVETEVAESVVEADVVEVTEDAPIVEDVEVVEVVETEVAEDAVEVEIVEVTEDAPIVQDLEVEESAPQATEVEIVDAVVIEPPAEPEPAPLPLELFEDIDLEDAEMMWNELRRGERSVADLEAMQQVFRAIAVRPTTGEATRRRAELRRRQIEIQLKLQDRIETLRRLEDRNVADQERINSIREALLDRSDYTVIGRLGRSRIYDGRRLPRLYRLEDPGSGRTIAYVVPKDGLDLEQGLGRIVGIVGSERVDQTYGLRLVSPYRFEIDLSETIPARKE